MKKVALIAFVVLAATALFGPECAAFTKDTDWDVSIQAGNDTWMTAGQTWGTSGTQIKLGDSSSPSTSSGTSMTNAAAYVRDMSGGSNGYVTNLKAALDQTEVEQTQVWDSIVLFVNNSYNSSTCSLRIWTTGISSDGPHIKLEVTQADDGTGFTAGQVLLDSWNASPALTTDTSKHYPWSTVNLYPNLAGLKAADAAHAHVKLRLTATTPASGPPLPSVAVTDDGAETASLTTLHASWSYANGPSPGSYQYAIGRSPTDLIVPWTGAFLNTEATVTGLHLVPQETYYWYVSAYEGKNGQYWICSGQSDGIKCAVPYSPSVFVAGPYITDTTQLHASWSASDPHGIVEYQYAIGRAESDLIMGWKSAGTATQATETGLALQPGERYTFYVKCKNGMGVWSSAGGCAVWVVAPHSLGEAKASMRNKAVYLPDCTVTSTVTDLPGLCIESGNCSAGIQLVDYVPQDWSAIGRGGRLDIAGWLGQTENGIALIDPTIMSSSAGDSVGALAFTGKHLANDPTESLEHTGLNVEGLLVSAYGRVTVIDTTAHVFYVDDGSGLTDGMGPISSPYKGLRVSYDASWTPPAVGKHVKVTGIRTLEKKTLTSNAVVNGVPRLAGQTLYLPVLTPRDTADIKAID